MYVGGKDRTATWKNYQETQDSRTWYIRISTKQLVHAYSRPNKGFPQSRLPSLATLIDLATS